MKTISSMRSFFVALFIGVMQSRERMVRQWNGAQSTERKEQRGGAAFGGILKYSGTQRPKKGTPAAWGHTD